MAFYDPTLTENDLLERCLKLDRVLFFQANQKGVSINRKINIVIAGSSSLILNKVNIMATIDIDILRISDWLDKELLEQFDMNTRVQCTEDCLPYNWEDRIKPLELNTKVIQYHLLSIEDAVCFKIAAYREKDKNHLAVKNLANQINWIRLKQCAQEMELSALNQRNFQWFVHRYNQFVKENHHEEAIIENI